VRPWQYVLEPLAGYLWLAARSLEHTTLAGPWNFGPAPDDAAPVRHLVERFVQAWGAGSWVTDDHASSAPHESAALRLDSDKASKELGWRTVMGLDRAVEATATWYRTYYDGEDASALSLAAIDDYERRAAGAGQPWRKQAAMGGAVD